ncbi:MAG TPA: hypothetical protein VK427_23720 [Kofleriaceae bacterium]|nr:hypothetical protein [Kofleriaceae bacterium]
MTGEQKIGFNLPDGKGPVDLSVISYETQVTKGGTTSMKPQGDPKTVFERRADLDRFETHAQPYMSTKIASLKRKVPRPIDGSIIDVEVPVSTLAGAEATVTVQIPYRENAAGELDFSTWWVSKSAFAKGSAFNP